MKRRQQYCSVFLFLLALSQAGAATDKGDYPFLHRLVKKAAPQWRNQDNFRLPAHVVPTHYEVKLKPNIYEGPEGDFSFEGWVTIYVTCRQATDVIVLHKDRLDVRGSTISVRQEGEQTELYSRHSYNAKRHFLRLHLRRPLVAGQRYVVDIHRFSGPLSTDGHGLYLSYYLEGNNTIYLVASQLEAVYARKAFPCFDEPQLKATFDVTLVRRHDTGRNYMSLSNSPLYNSTVIEGGAWIEDRFERTPKMSTYLLAFVICDFPSIEGYTATRPPVRYRTFAPPAVMQQARQAHDTGLRLFDVVSRHFRPRYSQALAKLDNVWLPHFNYGGMENWGLITYTVNNFRWADDPRMILTLNSVLVHEIAHQWFGNYVSPKWWKWAWLNEAFAYWWDTYITEQAFPGWNMTQEWLATDVQQVMRADASAAASHALEVPPTSPASITLNFDAFTNAKGAALVRMMQFVMGTDTFIDSLNVYLTRYMFDNADASDFFGVLDETMKAKGHGDGFMSGRMSAWFSQPGLPLVRVNRTTSGYRLTQTPFRTGPHSGPGYQWDIPITYATGEDPDMNKSGDDIRWLDRHGALEIETAAHSWILVNIDQMAYCRVLYDTDSWNALIEQLNRDHTVISAISRGQIINDAWTFARHDMLDLSIALRTLDYLKSELELLPWQHFRSWIQTLALVVEDSDLSGHFRAYIRNLVQKPHRELTRTFNGNTSPTDLILWETVVAFACRNGLEACVRDARNFFNDWKRTGVLKTHLVLGYQYLCTAVADGGAREWRHVLTHLTTGTGGTPEGRIALLNSLGCSTQPRLLKEFLDMCLSGTGGMARSDVPSCVSALTDRRTGRNVALRFLLEHSSELLESFPDEISYMLEVVTAGFSSRDFLDNQMPRLKEAFGQRNDLLRLLRRLERGARVRLQWMETNYPALLAWLTQ